jgi:hypothetical protein
MNADTDVVAHFSLLGLGQTAAPPSAPAPSVGVFLRSLLNVPGARAELVVDGRPLPAGAGEVSVRIDAERGTVMVEGVVRAATGPGQWRFDVGPEGVEPGGLRPLAGDAVQVTPGSLTFRLQGRPGERVAFQIQLANGRGNTP